VKSWKPANFPATATGMQGFGVVVNVPLYKALIERDVAAKSMPDSCRSSETFGDTYTLSADCQPSISSAEYAALMTRQNQHGRRLARYHRRHPHHHLEPACQLLWHAGCGRDISAGRALYNPKTPAADGYLSVLGGDTATPVTPCRWYSDGQDLVHRRQCVGRHPE